MSEGEPGQGYPPIENQFGRHFIHRRPPKNFTSRLSKVTYVFSDCKLLVRQGTAGQGSSKNPRPRPIIIATIYFGIIYNSVSHFFYTEHIDVYIFYIFWLL